MKLFDFIFVLSGGGPGTASATLTYEIYKTSFKDLDLGLGAAMSFFLLAFILAQHLSSLSRLGADGRARTHEEKPVDLALALLVGA